MLRQRRLPLGPGLRLLVAVDALLRPPELLRPVLKRKLGRRVEPLAGVRRPPRPIRAPSRPGIGEAALTRATRRCWSLLFLRRRRGQRRSFPRWRAGWRILCSPLFLFRRWPKGQRHPHFKERAISFSSGFSGPRATVCDALPPHSRPRPILPAAKRARFGDAVPPHAPLASPLWDPGSSAWMLQNALPSVPSSSTPLRCTTRYVDCTVGATCTASGSVACAAQPVSLAHAHNSTRLRDSVRQATSQVQRRSRDSVELERSCLARGDCCPPGKGQSSRSLQPR